LALISKSKIGFFFSLDALLAAAILLGGVLLISSNYIARSPTVHVNHISQDLITCLSELEMGEVENSYVEGLFTGGTLSSSDSNSSVIEVLGKLWSSDDITVAQNITRELTEHLISENYGFGLYANVNDMIYQRSNVTPTTINSAKKIISGVEYNRPVDGYVASASANQITSTHVETISFSPQGAGWYGRNSGPGWAYITKYFNISPDTVLTNATFYVSVHSDDRSYTTVDINNGACTINRNDNCFTGGEGAFCEYNVHGCLQHGINRVRLSLRNVGYNAHLHPGTFLQYEYELTESPADYSSFVSNRYYFDDTHSVESAVRDDECGAWQVVPFYIPPSATNVSVSVQVVGHDIYDYNSGWWWFGRFVSWNGWRRMRDYDYIMFLNDDSPFDSDNHPASNEVYRYSPNQVANDLIDGTNTIIVYFNNYGDYRWGETEVSIYSDPFNDPSGSSYVEVNYTMTDNVPEYGSIKVTDSFEFGGGSSSDKTTSFSFPAGATDMGDVEVNIVQTTSYAMEVSAGTSNPPSNEVFETPAARDVPTTVYIPENYLSLSETATNYIRLRDLGGNIIRPESTIDYSFYVPSRVGIGAVFSTAQEAVDDAEQRLTDLVGPFFNASNIDTDVNNQSDVPSLWGPALVEVRVWT
jgi:hypothetical protein